jgi:hypothetical protein
MSLVLQIYFRFRRHSGHDRTRCRRDPVTNDLRQTSARARWPPSKFSGDDARSDKCNRRGPKRKDVDFETQIGREVGRSNSVVVTSL